MDGAVRHDVSGRVLLPRLPDNSLATRQNWSGHLIILQDKLMAVSCPPRILCSRGAGEHRAGNKEGSSV